MQAATLLRHTYIAYLVYVVVIKSRDLSWVNVTDCKYQQESLVTCYIIPVVSLQNKGMILDKTVYQYTFMWFVWRFRSIEKCCEAIMDYYVGSWQLICCGVTKVVTEFYDCLQGWSVCMSVCNFCLLVTVARIFSSGMFYRSSFA